MASSCSCCRSPPGRGAEGHLAADPPEPPDYVFLWGWGVMNSTAIKEAVATGYPREKMYGVWWAGAEPDVKDVGDRCQGLQRRDHAARHRAQWLKDRAGDPQTARQGPGHGPKEKSARCCTCAA